MTKVKSEFLGFAHRQLDTHFRSHFQVCEFSTLFTSQIVLLEEALRLQKKLSVYFVSNVLLFFCFIVFYPI